MDNAQPELGLLENAEPRFDGQTYNHSDDQRRLSGQLERVFSLMSGGGWWTLREIATRVEASEASASARLRDLRKPRFGGHIVHRQSRGGGLWAYQLSLRHPIKEPA